MVISTTKIDPGATLCATRIRRTVSHLYRRLRPSLLRDGISMAKLNVIGQIYRAGTITPTELAAREGVKIQTLTRLLAELEAEGWLSRVPHASDGRQSVLSMTAPGKKRLAAAFRDSDASLARIIDASLSADERTLLLRACVLLEGLGEAFGSQPVGLDATSAVQP
mgnify:FL=1